MSSPVPILLFDGVCNLCNGMVRFIIRIDRSAKIKFAALQSPAGKSILQKFNLDSDDPDSVVYLTGDKYYLKSSALLHVFKDLGGGWKLFYGFNIIPEIIRDFFYNLIARSRYRLFGKKDVCIVPTPDIEKRFISQTKL